MHISLLENRADFLKIRTESLKLLLNIVIGIKIKIQKGMSFGFQQIHGSNLTKVIVISQKSLG